MKINIFNTDKKYDIIYADPPWKYDGTGGTKWCPASNYYKVMSDDELKKLKPIIDKISEENSLIFCWCVSSHLKNCIEVIESWGYKYITIAFVWYKRRANVGNYTMSSCELCLLFKKGKIPKDRVRNPEVKQFISQSITKHSEKPFEIYDRINKLFPKSKKNRIIC